MHELAKSGLAAGVATMVLLCAAAPPPGAGQVSRWSYCQVQVKSGSSRQTLASSLFETEVPNVPHSLVSGDGTRHFIVRNHPACADFTRSAIAMEGWEVSASSLDSFESAEAARKYHSALGGGRWKIVEWAPGAAGVTAKATLEAKAAPAEERIAGPASAGAETVAATAPSSAAPARPAEAEIVAASAVSTAPPAAAIALPAVPPKAAAAAAPARSATNEMTSAPAAAVAESRPLATPGASVAVVPAAVAAKAASIPPAKDAATLISAATAPKEALPVAAAPSPAPVDTEAAARRVTLLLNEQVASSVAKMEAQKRANQLAYEAQHHAYLREVEAVRQRNREAQEKYEREVAAREQQMKAAREKYERELAAAGLRPKRSKDSDD